MRIMKNGVSYSNAKRVILLSVALCFLTSLVSCERKTSVQFETTDRADFYLLGNEGVMGFSVENEHISEVSKTKVKMIQTSINPVVHRAELYDQYLVFTEEDWPNRNNQSVVSIDFENGIVHRYKTDHCAYTSSGASDAYYFASTVGENSFLSVYTPELEEVDYFKPEFDLLFSDFVASSDVIYTIGTQVEGTELENGRFYFKNYLVSISENEGEFAADIIKELEPSQERQYYFGDLIIKGEYLYSVSAGWRDLKTLERVMDHSAIYRYDLKNRTGEFYLLTETSPSNIYDLGDDFLAIEHGSSELQKLGFTLFDYRTLESQFVDISSFIIDQEEGILDIERLDLNRILVLTNHQFIIYDLQNRAVTIQSQCDETIGKPFHVWINQNS